MAIKIIQFKNGRKEIWEVVALERFSTGLKRMLVIQIAELINELEACEDQGASIGSVHAIRFLELCYQAA
jgi:hypothetical protein